MKTKLLILISFAFALHAHAGSATWSADPISGDWNTAINWSPATVPNAQTDIATFATSTATQVSLSSSVSLDSMIFDPGADSFSITAAASTVFTFYGDGVVNNSGQTQQFTLTAGGMVFNNSASAGDNTSYSLSDFSGIYFFDSATAGTANFTVQGNGTILSEIFFFGGTAGNATFTLLPSGGVVFGDGGTAGNATFNVAGGFLNFTPGSDGGQAIIDCSEGGSVGFGSFASVGEPHVTVHGATGRKSSPGILYLESYTASAGTFVVEGGTGQQTAGGLMSVAFQGTLSNGSVTVTGGTSGGLGGSLVFRGKSDGGTASLSLFGNALLDFSRHDQGTIKVGSIDGAGTVILGAVPLSVGTNNLETTFSGLIQDGDARPGFGPLIKVGTGTLTLGGANTYTGGTTVTAGGLVISNATGSGTGTGSVTVQAGTLGGKGIIAGPTTIGTGSGTGAFLQPGKGAGAPTTLTIQGALNLQSDSTYVWKLNTKKAKADEVVANGVTISGAQFDFLSVANQTLTPGTAFTAISNTASTPISGTFANLADGATISANGNNLQASYEGGDGNDLTLTVVQ